MAQPFRDEPAPPRDETELVARAQQGDLDAFNVLVEIHQRAVFNLSLRMVGNAGTAEDATQEAFISALRIDE